MFGIDPEKILSGLMKSMGISSEDFVRFLTEIQTELREMRADRLAFKPASIRVAQDITSRLDRLESKMNRLLFLLDAEVPHDENEKDAIHVSACACNQDYVGADGAVNLGVGCIVDQRRIRQDFCARELVQRERVVLTNLGLVNGPSILLNIIDF